MTGCDFVGMNGLGRKNAFRRVCVKVDDERRRHAPKSPTGDDTVDLRLCPCPAEPAAMAVA
jgi:hypothetical protein